MPTLVEQIGRIAVLRTLDRDELSRLLEAGRIEVWPVGSVIMEEGSTGPRMVILLDGRVEVLKRSETDGEILLAELGPGAVLGEMSLLTDTPRTATVRAATELRLFAIDRRNFEEMADDADPAALKIGLAIARVLASRLRDLNQRVVSLTGSVATDEKR